MQTSRCLPRLAAQRPLIVSHTMLHNDCCWYDDEHLVLCRLVNCALYQPSPTISQISTNAGQIKVIGKDGVDVNIPCSCGPTQSLLSVPFAGAVVRLTKVCILTVAQKGVVISFRHSSRSYPNTHTPSKPSHTQTHSGWGGGAHQLGNMCRRKHPPTQRHLYSRSGYRHWPTLHRPGLCIWKHPHCKPGLHHRGPLEAGGAHRAPAVGTLWGPCFEAAGDRGRQGVGRAQQPGGACVCGGGQCKWGGVCVEFPVCGVSMCIQEAHMYGCVFL